MIRIDRSQLYLGMTILHDLCGVHIYGVVVGNNAIEIIYIDGSKNRQHEQSLVASGFTVGKQWRVLYNDSLFKVE